MHLKIFGKLTNKRSLLFILILIMVISAALSFFYWPKPYSEPDKNIILIVLDTVRADKLGCYGNFSGLTPNIDKFTAEAVRFENAFSHAPWTLASVASMFTSQYPCQHSAGGQLGSFTVLPDNAVTVAEIFKKAGADTGAIINVLFISEKFGMTQGFDSVDTVLSRANVRMRKASQTTQAALKWLDRPRKKPFFLLVHYFDAHLTYDPPQPFRRQFSAPQDADTSDFIFGTTADMIRYRQGRLKLGAETIGRLEKLYNAEVAYLDSEVGNLLDGISKRGLDENTIIIIVADHGEEFFDHKGFEHGHTLYNELLHVPLIIKIPGTNKNRTQKVVKSTVRLIDIAPTLCELTGTATGREFMGKSLLPLIRGQKENSRAVLSQSPMWVWGNESFAWQKDGFKLIYNSAGGPPALFNVTDDKVEQNNLAESHNGLYEKMMQDADLIIRSIRRKNNNLQTPNLTDDDIERLRSLGYIR